MCRLPGWSIRALSGGQAPQVTGEEEGALLLQACSHE
jgi:hypothetical protein